MRIALVAPAERRGRSFAAARRLPGDHARPARRSGPGGLRVGTTAAAGIAAVSSPAMPAEGSGAPGRPPVGIRRAGVGCAIAPMPSGRPRA